MQMTSTKQEPTTREKTDDDIFIEEFAKDFFGTDQSDNDSSPSEKAEVNRTDYKKEKRKYKETYIPKTHNTDSKKSERKLESHGNALKNNNRHSSHILYPSDSRQSLMKRFIELRDEFLSLSDRLHDASMPKVSKKLTQVLTERQRLVKLLLDMDATPPSSDFIPGNDEKRFHDQSGSLRNGVSRQEFEMPKKTKSVHWSDEHLGGSIIQDPSVYANTTSNSSLSQVQRPGRYNENISKPPPTYKMVDSYTQTCCSRESQTDSQHDLNHCYCDMKIDDEMEYVKAILDEAAELRREACCMIWRAHYLEQLCDVDGLVKHVYRSTSNVPTLPRYSHLYR
jgi:hypothetical protein